GTMSGLALTFLVLAAFFGVLNTQKVKALRPNVASAQATSDAAPGRGQVTAKSNGGTVGPSGAKQQGKTGEGENRAAKAEAALEQAEKEKADLQAKLNASQQEITALGQRAEGASDSASGNAAALAENAHSADLQSQVD